MMKTVPDSLHPPSVEGAGASITRRAFLQSAATTSLALTASQANAQGKAPADRVIRTGLIGKDGHYGILLNSIPRLKNVRWTAYAKGEPGENAAWIRKQRSWTKKPAATTVEDLSRLERAAHGSSALYSIMLDMRGMPIFQAARTSVREGAVGEPILVSGQKSYVWGSEHPWYYKQRKTYGGTIGWVGIHALDYMRWVSGQDYTQVVAWQGNKAHPKYPGCEDHAGLLFQLSNGGTAVCHLDFLRPENAPSHGDSRLRIVGSEGVLEALEFGNRVHLISSKGAVGDLPLPGAVDLFSTFIAAMRGEGEPLISAEESFSITRVCLRAREAADHGAWVPLLRLDAPCRIHREQSAAEISGRPAIRVERTTHKPEFVSSKAHRDVTASTSTSYLVKIQLRTSWICPLYPTKNEQLT